MVDYGLVALKRTHVIAMIENYAQLIDRIIGIAIDQEGINQAGEGDIYEINNMPDVQYPIFWVSSTESHTEYDNYFLYTLTFYYVDRLIASSNHAYSNDNAHIVSSGMMVISNIIKKLRTVDDIYSIDNQISYTSFNDTDVFADKCAGVYCNVNIAVPKTSVCVQ